MHVTRVGHAWCEPCMHGFLREHMREHAYTEFIHTHVFKRVHACMAIVAS